jgi:hypothetical protein
MLRYLIGITLVIIISCNPNTDNQYINKYEWKYGSGGGSIGDWLNFEGDIYAIRNDTLFKHDTARAKVVSLDTNDYYNDVELKIKSFKNGKFAIYHKK